MAIAAGTRLASFEIVSLLGAGGMGEVYKARDTRLNRTVAIKVLPSQVSDNPELKQRLEREAQAIAALNHPNICVLHDIGHQEGTDYLVMEYLEGETLGDRLKEGSLPLDQALRYAIEIGDALDKAHRSGVVHRDVKPGNIMLTPSGAKLLDFGLAKLKPGVAQPAAALSELPTAQTALTAEGALLGTLQYMAPEQLEGEEADARSDIFAFGAALYEMVTGKKAFSGKSQASLIASILSSEPSPVSSVEPLTPPALDHVVTRCLAKAPDDRWTAMNDVVLQLRWIADRGLKAGAPESVSSRPSGRRLGWIGATALLAVATLALGLSYFRGSGGDDAVIRFSVAAPPNTTFRARGFAANFLAPALSPDGRNLAFVAFGADGRQMLWLRPLGSLDAQLLPGTEGASFPFWSPDGRFVGFFAQGKLKKTDVSGGLPLTLCDAPEGHGGTWNRDGVIVLASTGAGPLYRVSASGGTASPVSDLAKPQHVSHRWPHFLPDGRHFLYLARNAEPENSRVFLGSLDSKESREVLAADSNAVYVPSGQVLFVRNGTLMSQPFHAGRREMTGEPRPVLEQVQGEGFSALGAFSVSRNDVLAYRTTTAGADFELNWFDRSGKRLARVGEPGAYSVPQLSPDGRKLAVSIEGDIWVADLARGSFSRLTFDWNRCCPVWSPDGDRILFRTSTDLYQKLASGAGQEELLWKDDQRNTPTDWSRDGRFIIFQTTALSTSDLWVLPMSGERKPAPLLRTQFNEQQGRVSPDGNWIAYTSDESGRHEIYVQRFPEPSGKWQVSTSGGADPRWRADGGELYFISADRKLMAVPVKLGSAFEAGVPGSLFEVRVSGLTDVRTHYAVSADGQRFLVNTTTEDRTPSPIVVVVNWSKALGR